MNERILKKLHMIHKKHLDNRGTTMVETLVAFVVLMIILAIIYSAFVYCSKLRMKATDIDVINQKFNAEIYKDDNKINTDEVEYQPYSVQEGKGPVFYIVLDYENSEMMTYNVKDSATDYGDLKIRLNNIEATGYKSVNPLIQSEELATPKALKFRYKE